MNDTQSVLAQIDLLIRSRYPILYIISWEEARVLEELSALVGQMKQKRQIYLWSHTRGFGLLMQDQFSEEITLYKALQHIIHEEESAIYILTDIHSFIEDPKIIRGLRDAYSACRNAYKNVIILSPVYKLPEELKTEVAVIDFPYPTLSDLEVKLSEIMASVCATPKVKVNLSAEVKEQLLKAALGLTLGEAENVFAKSIVKDHMLDEKDVAEVLFEKQQIIKKTGILEYSQVEERMEDIGGLEILKEWLAKRAKAFTLRAKKFGLPSPKGVLLLGVQGCGKSLCSKAMASIWRMPLLKLDVGRVFSSYMGASEENIRTAIKVSESIAPCILWIDEVEKAFAGQKSSGMSDGGTTSRVFATFLTWLQEKSSPVFVIATANNVMDLPPEFIRKGRFDEIFFVDLPNAIEREKIFEIHLKRTGRGSLAEPGLLRRLAKDTEGFSGAEIEQVIISALFDAFDAGAELAPENLQKSIGETIPLSKTMTEEIESLRTWARARTRPASMPIEAFRLHRDE